MNENLFFILFFIVAVLVVWVCIDIFKLLKKEKGESSLSGDFSQNELFLRISEDFKKQLEALIEKEIQKNTEEFKYEFQKTSEEIIKNYRSQFADGNQEVQKILKELSEQASGETQKVAEMLSKELSQKFTQIYQSASGSLGKKITQTEEEIENYKKERFKELDLKIYKMIGEVAKKTIGKSVDLSDHEKLVMEALEKAKKEIF